MAGDFSRYYILNAEGHRIGLVTCLECGAAVVLDDEKYDEKHVGWHAKLDAKEAKDG